MTRVPFDKEKFLNDCMCGCTKRRQILLDKIEQYRETEPEMVQYLEWYRDQIWNDLVDSEEYHQMRIKRGDDQLNKDTATALRAVADKLEENGQHFMIRCVLPKLPIFSGDDHIERYGCRIEVSMVAGPLGG